MGSFEKMLAHVRNAFTRHSLIVVARTVFSNEVQRNMDDTPPLLCSHTTTGNSRHHISVQDCPCGRHAKPFQQLEYNVLLRLQ